MAFTDVEIRIRKAEHDGNPEHDRYPVEITVDSEEKLSSDEFEDGYLDANKKPPTPTDSYYADPSYGQQLFGWFFADDTLKKHWAEIRGAHPKRRIRLRVDANAPTLHQVPWEALCEPEEADRPALFLGAHSSTPFSRYLAGKGTRGKPIFQRPIRILMVAPRQSNFEEKYATEAYSGMALIDPEFEFQELQKVLKPLIDLGVVKLDLLPQPCSLAAIITELPKGYHVLHMVCHGEFSNNGQARLILANDENLVEGVKDKELATALAQKLIAGDGQDQNNLRMIFLASCESATRSSADALLGLAPQLVSAGVPAVVAMQDQVGEKTAREFASSFYTSLLNDEHGQIDLASNEARQILMAAKLPGPVIPVLFMRLRDGRLFGGSGEGKGNAPAPPEHVAIPDATGFVGREAELADYRDTLAKEHVVIITGMPGVGKTALAIELADQCAAKKKIFWHKFTRDEGVVAIIQRLASFLAHHGKARLWEIVQRTQLAGSEMPPPTVLLDTLIPSLRGQGFLLYFDDFHHVDQDPLLKNLVVRLRDEVLIAGHFSIIVTSRQIPDFLKTVEVKALEGLDSDDSSQLLRGRGLALSAELEDKLYAITEGNPQLLILAIDVLKNKDEPETETWIRQLYEAVDIERYLLSEVDAGLTPEEQKVMQSISVLDGYLNTRLAVEMIAEVGSVKTLLSDLVGRYLLGTIKGNRYTEYTQHAMLQAHFHDSLDRYQKRAMHLHAGEYCEEEGKVNDLLKAAEHYFLAGQFSRAAELVTSDIWVFVNQGQIPQLRQFLEEFSKQQVESIQWADITIAKAHVYALLEESSLATEGYEAGLASLDLLPDSPEVRNRKARICRGMGVLLRDEAPEEAIAWLERGLTEFGDIEDQEKAALYIRTGYVQINLGELTKAIENLEKGLVLLVPGISQLRAIALLNLGNAHGMQGNSEVCQDYYRKALNISQELGDQWRLVDLWLNLGIELDLAGDWQNAIFEYKKALEMSRELGSLKQESALENALGNLYTKLGKHGAAQAHFNRCLQLAVDPGVKGYTVDAKVGLARLLYRSGDLTEAQRYLTEAEQEAIQLKTSYQLSEIYGVMSAVLLADSEIDAALENADQAIELAENKDMDLELGAGLEARARACLADGQIESAMAAFEQSHSLLDGQFPYELARTKASWGQALIAAGETEQGQELLDEAGELFQDLGASYDLEMLEQVRSKLAERGDIVE